MSPREVVQVRGGVVVLTDLFSDEHWEEHTYDASLAIADPPYGDGIVTELWDKISAVELAKELTIFATRLQNHMKAGSQLCLWGGFGTPDERALFRTILGIEDEFDRIVERLS